jgi:LmbE family N-acetylglucosaminyl deacetylase
MKTKRILAIGAHPDDIEFGCFGLLAEYKEKSEIFCYVMSSGCEHDPSSGENRINESNKALSLLKPKKIFLRSAKGIFSSDFENHVSHLFDFIQKHKPDLILTHGPHDTHQEHQLVYQITMAAARRSESSILRYGILSNTLDFSPRFFKDISLNFNLKKKALKLHKSQAKKYYMSDEYLEIFHQNKYMNLYKKCLSESYEIERIFS